MPTPTGGHFVRIDGRTIFIRDSAPGSKRFPNQPTHSSGNMTHGTGMAHQDARNPVLLQQKSFGAMPGKGDWHGHGMAELIRLAGHHGLSRDETKTLMGRMNLNPAPNTVYIQHKRGVAHESLPSLNAEHAAEFVQHIQTIKGGSLPPAPVTPPPKPPEPVKPPVTPKPEVTEPPKPEVTKPIVEPPKQEPTPKGLMSADEFVTHIQTKHKELFDQHQAATQRVAELENQYKEQSKKLLSVEDPGSKIKLDYSKAVDWKAHQDAVAEARKGSGYQAEQDKYLSLGKSKEEAINHRNQVEENLNKAIHQELTLPKEKQANYSVTMSAKDKPGPQVKAKAEEAKQFLSSITNKDEIPYVHVNVRQQSGRANHVSGNIYVSRSDTTHTHVHEIGHAIETQRLSKGEAARAYLNERTGYNPIKPMRELTKAAGHSYNYDFSEVGREGGFYHPYVGKIYGHGSTEITSMGLEALHRNPAKFLKDDPGHFKFTLKQIRGV